MLINQSLFTKKRNGKQKKDKITIKLHARNRQDRKDKEQTMNERQKFSQHNKTEN